MPLLSHFAITHNEWVWLLVGIPPQFMAFSHYVWNHQVKRTLHSLLLDTTRLSLSLSLQHVVAHHSFTNIEGADPDIATAEVVRLAHFSHSPTHTSHTQTHSHIHTHTHTLTLLVATT